MFRENVTNEALTISERRRIREERQRTGAEGFREDVATICKCPTCGVAHYRPRTEAEANEKVKFSNE